MFSVGQKVLYGVNGVCVIDDITVKRIMGNNIEYYVLTPVCAKSSTLFVPTGNKKLVEKMRNMLTVDEVNQIISNLPEPGEWNDNKNERSEQFKEIISGGRCDELIKLIRLISRHERIQHEYGKHLHLADERILKEAEKMVSEELSMVLNVDRDAVIPMILENVG